MAEALDHRFALVRELRVLPPRRVLDDLLERGNHDLTQPGIGFRRSHSRVRSELRLGDATESEIFGGKLNAAASTLVSWCHVLRERVDSVNVSLS